jgi:hypothetical protein
MCWDGRGILQGYPGRSEKFHLFTDFLNASEIHDNF